MMTLRSELFGCTSYQKVFDDGFNCWAMRYDNNNHKMWMFRPKRHKVGPKEHKFDAAIVPMDKDPIEFLAQATRDELNQLFNEHRETS